MICQLNINKLIISLTNAISYSRLKSRYMSVALRGSPRGGLGTLRRTASLEYFLDMDKVGNILQETGSEHLYTLHCSVHCTSTQFSTDVQNQIKKIGVLRTAFYISFASKSCSLLKMPIFCSKLSFNSCKIFTIVTRSALWKRWSWPRPRPAPWWAWLCLAPRWVTATLKNDQESVIWTLRCNQRVVCTCNQTYFHTGQHDHLPTT